MLRANLEKLAVPMNNFATILIKNIAAFIKKCFGNTYQVPPKRCQFCGEMGHDINDCPNAAKYKLFNVDRD